MPYACCRLYHPLSHNTLCPAAFLAVATSSALTSLQLSSCAVALGRECQAFSCIVAKETGLGCAWGSLQASSLAPTRLQSRPTRHPPFSQHSLWRPELFLPTLATTSTSHTQWRTDLRRAAAPSTMSSTSTQAICPSSSNSYCGLGDSMISKRERDHHVPCHPRPSRDELPDIHLRLIRSRVQEHLNPQHTSHHVHRNINLLRTQPIVPCRSYHLHRKMLLHSSSETSYSLSPSHPPNTKIRACSMRH